MIWNPLVLMWQYSCDFGDLQLYWILFSDECYPEDIIDCEAQDAAHFLLTEFRKENLLQFSSKKEEKFCE